MSRFRTTFRTTDGAKHTFYCDSIQALRMLEGGLLAQRATIVSSITHYEAFQSTASLPPASDRPWNYRFWQAPYDIDGVGDSKQCT